MTEAYRQGFMSKCAEHGVDGRELLEKIAQSFDDISKARNASNGMGPGVLGSEISTAAGKANAAGNWDNSNFMPYNNVQPQLGVDNAIKDNESAPLGYNPIAKSELRNPDFNGGNPFSPQQDFDSLSPEAKTRFDKVRGMRPDSTIAFPSRDDPNRLWTYVSPDGTVSGSAPQNGNIFRMRMPSRIKSFGEYMDDQATRQEDRFYTGAGNRSDPRMMQMAGFNTTMPRSQAF